MSQWKRVVVSLLLAWVTGVGASVAGLSPASAAGSPLPYRPSSVAAARLCDICNSDVVVTRTADSRVFYALVGTSWEGGLSINAEGWREIPGGAETWYPPAVALWGGTVTAAITGIDKRV